MDKNKVKGTVDDIAGRAKRQAGEWTGDLNKQVDGAAQQVKGKAEKAWGNMKDAARSGADAARSSVDSNRQSSDRGHSSGPASEDRANHKTH